MRKPSSASPSRHAIAAVASLALVAATGCDPQPTDSVDGTAVHMSGDVAGTGGKIFVDWTFAGAAPSATACAGIDHLELGLDYGRGSVTIAPIPCTLTRFRYDALPTGFVTLSIAALDSTGCVRSRGQAAVTVDFALPSAPTPTVDLTATTRGCR